MTTWIPRAAALAAVAALALAVAACTGGDDGVETAATPTGVELSEHRFGELKIAYDDGIDYLDPGLSYTTQGWGVMLPVHLGLLTYSQEPGSDGAELIPALAEDLPEISADGLTYTLRLREGRTYSDGTPVRASDFAATVERLFRLDSPGAGFFTGIAGADRYARTKQGSIRGIITDDADRTIEIQLRAPQADFLNILAMMFAALVPAGTPADDQSTKRIPANGPYMIERYVPDQIVSVVRNPRWEPIEGIPNGNPDRMTFNVVPDPGTALESVIEGENDYDFHPIPIERLSEVRRRYAERLKLYAPANTYYFFMDTRIAPFNRLAARQAVNYAIDRGAIAGLYGGLATPTQNVLPPAYPQYEKIEMYPYDLERARRLVQQSGTAGTTVTIWTSSRETLRKPSEYLRGALNRIGFKATVKVVDPAAYLPALGDARTRAQIGISNWFHDYPHPLNWFDALLNGNRIRPTNNYNFGHADVEAINQRIEELKREPELSDEVNEEWKEIERLVLENALWAPIVNRTFTELFSSSMDLENCYVSHVLYQFLYASACKKE